VRDERAGLDPRDGLPQVLVEVTEGLGGPGRLDPILSMRIRATTCRNIVRRKKNF
jgi:hypothetical protein